MKAYIYSDILRYYSVLRLPSFMLVSMPLYLASVVVSILFPTQLSVLYYAIPFLFTFRYFVFVPISDQLSSLSVVYHGGVCIHIFSDSFIFILCKQHTPTNLLQFQIRRDQHNNTMKYTIIKMSFPLFKYYFQPHYCFCETYCFFLLNDSVFFLLSAVRFYFL